MQDRASERLQDQIIEEIKELESTKTEEALQIAEKEHDLWMYQQEKEEAQKAAGSHLGTAKKFDEMAGLGRGKKERRWRVEAGTRRRSGSAGNHYRVGCGGRHSCGPGYGAESVRGTRGKEWNRN